MAAKLCPSLVPGLELYNRVALAHMQHDIPVLLFVKCHVECEQHRWRAQPVDIAKLCLGPF